MATEIRMPQLGLTMTEGTVEKLLKNVGDKVSKGDVLMEISTDKLNSEIESSEDGFVIAIYGKEGETIPVQGLLAVIGAENEKIEAAVAPEESQVKQAEAAVVFLEKTETIASREHGKRIRISPMARKVAEKLAVNIEEIKGTGPSGRIIHKDVIEKSKSANVSAAPAIIEASVTKAADIVAKIPVSTGGVSNDTIKPLSSIRKVIARRMTESKHTAPHVTLTTEVNVDKTIALRDKLNAKRDVRFTYTDILVKMAATALRNVPGMNISINDQYVIQHERINIGVAVSLDDGLIVPVVMDADKKGLTTISLDTRSLISKARENKLTGDELSGGTFTISNLGNYDVDGFTPVINLPEVAILGVGRIVKKPIVNGNNEIVPASMMVLSLSFDHRAVDGALAAKLLKKIKDYLEDPDQMII